MEPPACSFTHPPTCLWLWVGGQAAPPLLCLEEGERLKDLPQVHRQVGEAGQVPPPQSFFSGTMHCCFSARGQQESFLAWQHTRGAGAAFQPPGGWNSIYCCPPRAFCPVLRHRLSHPKDGAANKNILRYLGQLPALLFCAHVG